MKRFTVKGFTLIELITVIAIIGVLAAILVPSMMSYVGSSKLATANANAKLAHTNAATYATKCSVMGLAMNSSASITVPSSLQKGADLTEIPDVTTTPNSDMLLTALKVLMGSDSPTAGYVEVAIHDSGVPEAASWAKGAGDIFVGNYPDISSDKGASWCMTQP